MGARSLDCMDLNVENKNSRICIVTLFTHNDHEIQTHILAMRHVKTFFKDLFLLRFLLVIYILT